MHLEADLQDWRKTGRLPKMGLQRT